MQQPPPDTVTVAGEGADLKRAIQDAAAKLEVPEGWVLWSIDLNWFRNDAGRGIPRDTVRIKAWARNKEEMEAADDAQAWLNELLGLMGFDAKVSASLGRSGQVVLDVDVDRPGRVIGRRGVTLNAIQSLLMLSVGADHPDRTFRIELPDRREDGGEEERDDRRGRDRDDRRGRERDDRRGRDRDDRRDRGNKRRRADDAVVEGLRRIASKVAKRVLRSGEPEAIRKELNSFERRVVHMAVSEIDGVGSRSIGEGPVKQIELYPDGSSAGEE